MTKSDPVARCFLEQDAQTNAFESAVWQNRLPSVVVNFTFASGGPYCRHVHRVHSRPRRRSGGQSNRQDRVIDWIVSASAAGMIAKAIIPWSTRTLPLSSR